MARLKSRNIPWTICLYGAAPDAGGFSADDLGVQSLLSALSVRYPSYSH